MKGIDSADFHIWIVVIKRGKFHFSFKIRFYLSDCEELMFFRGKNGKKIALYHYGFVLDFLKMKQRCTKK